MENLPVEKVVKGSGGDDFVYVVQANGDKSQIESGVLVLVGLLFWNSS